MLITITIMMALLSLATPAFHAAHSGNQFKAHTNRIASLLEQARTSAMSLNTSVYVGFQEVPAGTPASQAGATADGSGQLLIMIAASTDGTRQYDPYHPETSWLERYQSSNGNFLKSLGNLEHFPQLHLTTMPGPIPDRGPMGKSSGRQSVNQFYKLGHQSCKSVTPIKHPIGTPLDANPDGILFEKIIQFDPKGVARIQYATNADEIKQCMEITLESDTGPLLSNAGQPAQRNHCAIQLDPMTGSVRVYRP